MNNKSIQVNSWIQLYEQNDPAKNSLKRCEEIQLEMNSIESLLTYDERQAINDYYGCEMFDY